MASLLPFLSFFFFHFSLLLSSSSACHLSSSCAGYEQCQYWLTNVETKMPPSISSKLSPFDNTEMDRLLISHPANFTTFTPQLCQIANLACNNTSPAAGRGKGKNCFCYSCFGIGCSATSMMSSFFRLSLLEKGRKLVIPDLRNPYPNRAFIPYRISTTFTLGEESLERMFPYAFSSQSSAKAALSPCTAPALPGETKICAKNMEDMISFAKQAVGTRHRRVLALASDDKFKGGKQQVVKIEQVVSSSETVVACHELLLPFAAYYCHAFPMTKLYSVEVAAAAKVFAICHFNTSSWMPNHVSFKLLHTSPGKSEVCHWLTQLHIVWVGQD